MHQLPPELFYQIALHLPFTKDVLALSLTNSRVHGALSTPALFKARLALRGWDVSAWNDEDAAAQSPGDFKRWMRIDHTYCRTIQLFDEAIVDGYFLVIPDSPIDGDVLWSTTPPNPGQNIQSRISRTVFDGEKTVIWLKKLSGVLPLFVTHHRTYFLLLLFERHNIYLKRILQVEKTSRESPRRNISMHFVLIRGLLVTFAQSSGG